MPRTRCVRARTLSDLARTLSVRARSLSDLARKLIAHGFTHARSATWRARSACTASPTPRTLSDLARTLSVRARSLSGLARTLNVRARSLSDLARKLIAHGITDAAHAQRHGTHALRLGTLAQRPGTHARRQGTLAQRPGAHAHRARHHRRRARSATWHAPINQDGETGRGRVFAWYTRGTCRGRWSHPRGFASLRGGCVCRHVTASPHGDASSCRIRLGLVARHVRGGGRETSGYRGSSGSSSGNSNNSGSSATAAAAAAIGGHRGTGAPLARQGRVAAGGQRRTGAPLASRPVRGGVGRQGRGVGRRVNVATAARGWWRTGVAGGAVMDDRGAREGGLFAS